MKNIIPREYDPAQDPYRQLRAIDSEERAKQRAGTLTDDDVEDYFNRAKECYIQINHFCRI